MPNLPKMYIDEKSVDTLRAAVENQGKWIYFLTMEGMERGLDSTFAKEAMYALGRYYADTEFKDCNTPEELGSRLMRRSLEQGSEASISQDEGQIHLKIGYCPMLHLWEQLTDDPAKYRLLCDIGCEMYRGMAEGRGLILEKKEALAAGCDHCTLCFRKAL